MRERIHPDDMLSWEEWRNMVRRPRDYRNAIYAPWRVSFNEFLQEMGNPPHGKHLKRHNDCRRFSKENCYWG